LGELTKALEAQLAAIELSFRKGAVLPRNPAPTDKWRHDWLRARRLRELLPYQPPRPRAPVDLSFLRAATAEQRPIIASESASGDTAAGVPEIVDDPSAVEAPLALSATEDRIATIITAICKYGPLPPYLEAQVSGWAELGGTEACDTMRKGEVVDAMKRAIRSKWPAELGALPSRFDVGKMATFVRSPKAKAGGRKPKG
jgi:hypothetical protein